MPVKTRTLHDYGRRVARAMAHLAANLDRTPSLEELAEVDAFSPFHFHRVYREIAGETPAETLARGRLSRAAHELLRTQQPIARIARRAGYGSAAAFTRAFRAAHGVPPGTYRARGGIGAIARPAVQTETHAMHAVTLRAEPAMHLALLPHRGAYAGIGAVFDRLMAWAGARGLIGEATRFIGLYHDDPVSVPEADLRSEAGVTVPPGTQGDGDVTVRAIPALRVAVLRFQGPYAELEELYAWLYGTWLPESGEEPADAPAMEDYLNDCRSLPPTEWLTEILLPLTPR